MATTHPSKTPTTRATNATRASSGNRIRIGVGGWNFAPWQGTFYPEKWPKRRELEYASRHLTSIEINSTFYGSQKPATFRHWFEETPDDFVFSVKASRYATHRRVLAEAGESISRFFDSGVLELGKKLGPVNWQFAPTKAFDAQDFEHFLSLLPTEAGGYAIRHALEVRHESFAVPEFVALARKYHMAIVLAGDAKFPCIADVTAPFVYARLMGTQEHYKLGYAPKAMTQWIERAQAFAQGGAPKDLDTLAGAPPKATHRDVFLYVISGFKERNPAAAMAMIDALAKH
ncbi:DUF72 domain-containing protein [Pandoraea apista]|uniref:DUF72 domain-containing protein n=1 Tax=Pandoraea apista TaxID=93218 RepID=UPI00058A9B15|nr:DUF72 domain-containing protein [Pandoraea apista]AJE99032.1 hypothetical protein SG18_14045 [Pandoraea apista]AKH73123.1 hypothetical protein XM39_14240 [Pandoraea apista]AKI61518.1 hypothetical protein AA956_06580 [Pandoraea apista]ALS65423.1 hypothetical protein AT395_10835 [Pandoraea apista]RRW95025.1 DUF72 domain-containing protein [Pandoraea apista]